MGGKIKKPKLQADVNTILANNFANAPPGTTPQPPPAQMVKEEEPPKV